MELLRATVTQASPVKVRVDGATSASAAIRLTSYTPVLADRVLVVVNGPVLLVLGKEAT